MAESKAGKITLVSNDNFAIEVGMYAPLPHSGPPFEISASFRTPPSASQSLV